jgi:hypothetical protein
LKTLALNEMTETPDRRALQPYLKGLSHSDEEVRTASRDALRSIASSAREKIIRRARNGAFSEEVMQQLAQVFEKPKPIRDWHIVGPFDRKQSRPFELNSLPYEQSFEGKTGAVTWTQTTAGKKDGHVDLENVLREIDHASAFARTTVEVDEAMETELVLGSDDGLGVWVNGKKVFEDMGTRGWEPDQFRVPVSLKKGENEIVCRIEENTGSWGFSVQYVRREFHRLVYDQSSR